MGKEPSPTLTGAELRIMRVLWTRDEATNVDIVGAIDNPRLARNTVMTTLGVLERKGYVDHRVDGRTFLYRAVVAEDDVRASVLDSVLQRFFGGSAEALVAKLLDREAISVTDRERIQALFEKASGS